MGMRKEKETVEVGKMRGGRRIGGRVLTRRVRDIAAAALKESDIESVFSEAGLCDYDEAAGTALKSILAEKTTEYIQRGMAEAKRRRMRFGAGALIIAAEKDRW